MINLETMATESFVEERKDELGINPIRELEKGDLFFTPIVEGFFDAEMRLQPGSGWGASFCVNDDAVYAMAVEIAKNYSPQFKDNPHRLALWTTQQVILGYFGNIQPSSEASGERERRFSKPSSRVYSLSEIKDGAMCYERAAVAHNLLLFLGEKSQFAVGYYAEGKQPESQHAFVLTERDGRVEIYDPMNPVIGYHDDSCTLIELVLPYVVQTEEVCPPSRNFVVENDYKIKYRGEDGKTREEARSRRRYRIKSR